MTSITVARATVRGSWRSSTKAETTAPSTVQINAETSSERTERPDLLDDLGNGVDPLAQVAALDVAQRGQAGTGDVTLVARNQLFGQPRFGFAADEQVDQ